MAKITRKTAKIFGVNALTDQIAQFGSLSASSPAFSTDLNTIQSLSNWLSGWFAAVEDENSPAIEDMNAFCYVMAYQVAYLMQEGLAEWDAGTTYFSGSIVSDGSGNIFVSLTNNNLNNALTDPTNWKNYVTLEGALLANGTVALTSNWAAGNFTATFNGVQVGSAANRISGLATIINSGTLTLPTSTDTLVGRATTDTLTNKTLTAPVISTITNTGTLTLPTSTDTLVGKATTDTLTNKTLTAPVISTITNSGTLTLPTGTDTLVGRATTDTLTNKTLTTPIISGITNGSDAGAGVVGEYVVGRQSSATNFTTTNTFQNIVSISLTAGDWDVSGLMSTNLNGSTITNAELAISINSGNTTTDQVVGDNQLGQQVTASEGGVSIPNYRINITGTTTVYLKGLATFVSGNPQYRGRISARRVR